MEPLLFIYFCVMLSVRWRANLFIYIFIFQIVCGLRSSSSVEKLDLCTRLSSGVVKCNRERNVWSLLYCSGANVRGEAIQTGQEANIISRFY